MMRTQKTFFTLAAVLVVAAFLGLYGHGMVDDHGAEEACEICVFLQSGASVGVVFFGAVCLVTAVLRFSIYPRFVVCLPIDSPGRSPPVV